MTLQKIVRLFYYLHFTPSMGANLGGMGGDVSHPKIRLHPLNIFMPHFSELDDLFFGLHYILGKESVIWEVMTFFWSSFHCTHCSGQKFGQPRGDGEFAKSSPQSRKMAKNGQFCRIFPPNAQHRFAPLTPSRITHKKPST